MRTFRIRPGIYAVDSRGLIYGSGTRWFGKPIVRVDENGLWWSPELGPFKSKAEALAALEKEDID